MLDHMLFIESVDVRFNKTGKTFSPKIPGKAYLLSLKHFKRILIAFHCNIKATKYFEITKVATNKQYHSKVYTAL